MFKPASILCLAFALGQPFLGMAAASRNPEESQRHWAFEPVREITLPQPRTTHSAWVRNPVDLFILSRLEKEEMRPAPEADRLTWLRRITLDLIGLPPTPEEIAAFLSDPTSEAYGRVVDRLLDSPRYGERWGQHWLDVARYADTHGFEVNTERPNAWPYRDYVVRAFNRDTPYDHFIREQLIGDQLGQDAATGFLVTASVLLPGQIGADEPSKRLARQDSLDEIVVNVGQSFLGLSINCARCHDHKFDPISQRDYYALQALVAGVEYGERELRSAETEALREEEARLRRQTTQIDSQLSRFVPLAQLTPNTNPPPQAKLNEEAFPALAAKFIRFTIHDANLHPTLGLIEPCLDEVEIFSEEAPARNLALATTGTRVSASSSKSSDLHRLEHINDGRYGNARSWMSDEAGRGWILFELPTAARISRIRWSRDREGMFTDRLPTAYTLEAGPSLDQMTRLAYVPPPRPPVNARANTDRFKPTQAHRVRFTIRETNQLEPCLDELEVFDLNGVNVGLASAGAIPTASGSTVVADRHELKHVNDGRYGNARSWMSNAKGTGWIELELKGTPVVDRVIWGRDRDGEFSDRLATQYTIEIDDGTGQWRAVANSGDRAPIASGSSASPAMSLAGLSAADAMEASKLMQERKALERQIKASTEGRMAYAGSFRPPDDIRLLSRGDPEQPKEPVQPGVLPVLGATQLTPTASDVERRRALADWIASPQNPLTARVMINRIWQGHFGVGLVETPSDFGRSGAKPSHPELLDWLASEFIRSGWSMKQMHRLITLSATYRQSNRIDPNAQARDADVKLLWRYPSRRLEAETIRDAMLAVSGRLNVKMYGRGFDLFDKRGGLSGFQPVESYSGEGLRRMIYAHKVRREREAVFGSFDCPDAGQSTARRRESTTPIQALNLLNSRFTHDESEAMAARIRREADLQPASQIRQAYRLALGREPAREEIDELEPAVREHGLATLCRALFNSNEFLFLP
jgi:hypothetical protein